MLKTFRKYRRSLFGFLIVGLMALFMVPFGMDLFSGRQNQGTVIKVGDTEISSLAYYQHLRKTEDMFRAQLGANYAKFKSMFNLEQRAVDELINNVLMAKLIQTLELSASTQQIEEKIAAHPYFSGKVTKQALDVFVRSQGLTPAKLESVTKDSIIQEQLLTLFSDMNIPTEVELEEIFRDEQRTAAFRYLAFPPPLFEDKVQVDEDSLKAYYTDHNQEYRKPRSLTFSFLAFNPRDFEDKVELTEEDINDSYHLRKHSYYTPKQIHLRRILLKKAAPKEEKSALAEALSLDLDGKKDEPLVSTSENPLGSKKEQGKNILEQLTAGVPFAELAQKFSEDEATKKDGGDMGWLQYEKLEPKLREAAAKLETGEHSDLIEIDSGFAILYAQDKKERKEKTLDQVRPLIEQLLRKEDAPVYARAEADIILQNWLNKDIPLKDFAAQENHPLVSTEKPLSRGEGAAGIPAALTDKISTFGQGAREVVEVGDGSYLVEVSSVHDAYIPDFVVLRPEIEKAYRKLQSQELAKKAAEESLAKLLGKVAPRATAEVAAAPQPEQRSAPAASPTASPPTPAEAKQTMEQIATQYGLTLESTPAATRATASGPVFSQPEAKRTAFTLTKEKPLSTKVLEVAGSYYLIELESSTAPQQSEFDSKKEELRSRERKTAGSRLMQTLMITLREEAEVWVDSGLLDDQRI